MNKNQIDELQEMILKHNTCGRKIEREKLRNKIFIEMLPFLKKWMSGILSKKKVFLSQEEMLSKSWDCFLYSLKHYKVHRGINLPNHFYTYTNFYLRIIQIDYKEEIDQYHRALTIDWHPENFYIHLEELNAFRKTLDDEYKMIFDDALMSMMPSNKDKKYRIKESKISNLRYQESKKVFKTIIDFLIRKG